MQTLPTWSRLPALIALLLAPTPTLFAAEGKPLGYQDTPIIPGTPWHVHDGLRPQPRIVTPGAWSSAEKAGTAPSDATVLFDGTDLTKWRSGKGGDAAWKVENGYMEVVKGTGDIFTREDFGPDYQLHLEWAAASPAKGSGQGRSNSGVFLFGRYEVQVLDNFQNQTYPDGQATAIYGYMPPLVNASRPPGEFQSYDIIFHAPRFNADKTVAKPAYVTVLHNGVVTQYHVELIGETPHKQVGKYSFHGEKGPIKLQDHGDPVRFRNIWIRPLGVRDQAEPGPTPTPAQNQAPESAAAKP